MNKPLRQVPCRACQEYIVFLPTSTGKTMPVDVDTVTEGDDEFNPKVHVSHFATCPEANRFRKRDRK